MSAPVLTTERLILRPHQPDDFAGCCALWADPEVTRFIGGRPSTPEEVWSRMLRYAGLWSMLNYGYFLVTERESGAVVGELGLADFHRDCDPRLDAPEAGWALVPQFHGKGLAREALTAVLAWADGAGISRTVCMISPDNTPSRRLATALGYADYTRTTYKDQPSILYQRLTPAAAHPS